MIRAKLLNYGESFTSMSQELNQSHSSWWIDSFFLTLVLGSLFFLLLGSRPLFVPDEGRYAEIAREMLQSGNYLTPYLNGIKYFEKPILFYWLGAFALKIGGINLWSLRSINALLGLLGCLLTYATTRKLYDRLSGFLAALILGSSALYFVMVHMISLDLPVTVFFSASLYAFLLSNQTPLPKHRRFYMWLAASFAALAVLTKGLIGIVFPCMIIASWIAIMGNWSILKRLYLPSSVIIFLLIVAPWHILVGMHNPEFFYFYFIEQHFLRYATVDIGHYQPVWFFIPNLLIGFFPWIVFLPQALVSAFPSWKQRRHYQNEIFFLLWIILVFVFFSFSKSKLIPYILPIFPPLAILVARYLSLAIINHKARLGIKVGYAALIISTFLLAIGFYLFTHYLAVPHPKTAKIYLGLAAFTLVAGTLLAGFSVYRDRLLNAVKMTFTTTWLFLLLVLAAIPSIDNRTIQPLTHSLKPMLTTHDEVVTFDQYYQDLPFYLERRVSILNWRNELSFGMQHQDTHEWMIDDNTFWQRWHSSRRIFIFIDLERFQQLQKTYPNEHFYVLNTTLTNALVSNKP